MAHDTHEPCAAENRAERREHLAQVRAAVEEQRRAHRAAHAVVGGIAVQGDQRQSGVALVSLRMGPPFGFVELTDFVEQTLPVEEKGQSIERSVEFHATLTGIDAESLLVSLISRAIQPKAPKFCIFLVN